MYVHRWDVGVGKCDKCGRGTVPVEEMVLVGLSAAGEEEDDDSDVSSAETSCDCCGSCFSSASHFCSSSAVRFRSSSSKRSDSTCRWRFSNSLASFICVAIASSDVHNSDDVGRSFGLGLTHDCTIPTHPSGASPGILRTNGCTT